MADQRTMAELLRSPTKGYAEAIVVPSILAKQFELKHSLINKMTSDQFFGLEKDNPRDHIRWFNKITSTIKYKDVPNSAIKLMLFPFSLAGAARRWLEKEPPRSTHTWEDLVSKFINEFFAPSRTTNLRNEIFIFQQRFDESFHEAWDRYKDLLRACPLHGFTKLHQLDTFYNALNPADQDSLNAAVGGNLLERRTQDVLTIIENKSKQTSVVTTAMTAILKQFQATPPPASVKSVEEIYVTCDGAHPYYQCLSVGGNTFPEIQDNIQGYVLAVAVNYNQGDSVYRPPSMANQIRPPGSLPSNTVANLKGKLKAITTRSGLVLDGPIVSTPPSFINPEEDERVEETLTYPDLSEYTIKVLPPPVQKYKPPSQINYIVHQRDPLHPNIPYPSRMLKQKQQEKDEKMLKALLSNKKKLQELTDTPLNANCSAVILKKLPEKLRDPRKFLISCGFKGGNVQPEKLLDLDSTKDLHPPLHVNPLSGSTTYSSSPNPLLEELADELTLITFPLKYDDDLQFDGEKIKESKLLIDELDLHCDLPPSGYDSIISQDFSRVDSLSSTNNEDKLDTSNASLVLEDFDPPFYEPLFFKEVSKSKMLLLFSSENEEKVFKPRIHTSEKVHSSLILELSHQGDKFFKINQIFKSLMKIFLFSCGKDTHILAVPCLHFYPIDQFKYGGIGDANSSSSEIAKLTHSVNQQTSAVTTAMTAILKQFQATPPPASVKAVEEICVTCGGGHPYYQCLATGGNIFSELRDNIQRYIAAVAVNYN
nr:reverse transcriptase domain-containing protein [Tanacetum cinerariifolium]